MINEKSLNSLLLLDSLHVIGKANEMRATAILLDYQIRKLEQEKIRLMKSWEGPAEQIFISKLESLITKMQMTKKRLTQTAELVTEVSNKITRTESELEAALRK